MIRAWTAALIVTVTLPVGGQQSTDRAAAIDALFAVSGDAPGCAVGVRHNGVVVHRAGYGLADLEHRVPIMPTSVFYTGSLSKQFTAASIAVAANDGHLDLDAPVRQYVSEMPEVAKDVTIRQLIHHTGGLREKWDLLAMQGVPVATTLITQQMVLDLVRRQQGVNFPAGTQYAYSNTGYDLLATVIERTTGQPIRVFAHEWIFGPLGMTRTLYADKYGEVIPDRVMGYARRDGAWTLAPAMVETVGSGSVYSTVDDLLTWASVWEIETGPQELRQQLETPGTLSDGTPLTYAWGQIVDEWNGMRRVHHTGALAGYRTALWRLPEQKWAAVVLCNSVEAGPEAKVGKLAAMYFGEPPRSVAVENNYVDGVALARDLEVPADLVGDYWSDELQVTWSIARRDTSFVLHRGTLPPVVIRAGAPGRVVIGSWQVQVERDGDAKVTGLVVGAGRSSGVRFRRR